MENNRKNVNNDVVRCFDKDNGHVINKNNDYNGGITSLVPVDSNIVVQQGYEVLNEIQKSVDALKNENRSQYFALQCGVNELKDGLLPKKKKKKMTLPLRDEASKFLFLDLVLKNREPGEHKLSYARFRIACILLFFSGLRLNEIRLLREVDILQIIKFFEITIYQSKTNTHKKVVFPSECVFFLEKYIDDIDYIFSKGETLSTISSLSFIRFFNNRLKKFTSGKSEYNNKNLKSHSFRVNFITSLLKHAPLDIVCDIVGHKSISTTNRYNRNKITKEQHIELLKNL